MIPATLVERGGSDGGTPGHLVSVPEVPLALPGNQGKSSSSNSPMNFTLKSKPAHRIDAVVAAACRIWLR